MSMVRCLRLPHSDTRTLFVLVMLAFVLRAMVPAGFMPGSHDGHGGPFTLMLCNPTGAQVAVTLDLGVAHGGHHDEHHDQSHGEHQRLALADWSQEGDHGREHAAVHEDADDEQMSMQGCPFCLVAAQAVLPTADVTVPLTSVGATTLPVAIYVGHSPISAQGPPLGSRAPPFHLG
jgi:hypothetical protein